MVVVNRKIIKLNKKPVFENLLVQPPSRHSIPAIGNVCFIYILKGNAKIYSPENSKTVENREGMLVRCGSIINDPFTDPQSGVNELVVIHLHPDILSKVFASEIPNYLRNKNIDGNASILQLGQCMFIARYFDGLLPYFDHPKMVDDEWVILKLREFIHIILQTNYGPEVLSYMASLVTPRVYSFKKVIEGHLFSKINIVELANLTHCSLGNFNRKFKKIYGDSPARYIRNRRLDHAADILLASNEEISEIAYICRFNSISHFSTSFRKRFRYSPSEYRQIWCVERANKIL